MSVTSFKVQIYEDYINADMLEAIEPPPFNGMFQFTIQLKISFSLITVKKGEL